jgi:hypothetical protein
MGHDASTGEPDQGQMKNRLAIYALLVLFVSGFSGCTLCETYAPLVQDDPAVVDAWERGKRAEERGEYEKAKEEYYFVKRFATTSALKTEAQERYQAMSRVLEERGEKH